ncbi:hypothetical protein [Noviherbaspirillum saxi]|uniref:Uncharacterized protein n=1 Tax=Noviherbaspirillum saxi TaxID=2320863 RepID=A0A3A3FTD5_9BURK|nr:hypothetical protein [Noviherbaspirillum saxi]RJF99053.1 hypothetical protein D3871_11415 [Noviherbaspirillum saxi]
MNVLDLLHRAKPSSEPVYAGEWATLSFRPDLGSQQQFIVGVAAAIKNDTSIYIKWLPSLQRLSSIYGDAISTTSVRELFDGASTALRTNFKNGFSSIDTGSPNIKITPCGYIATHDVEKELLTLLKRHAGVVWAETSQRGDPTDDEWAYSLMRRSLDIAKSSVFVPNRTLVLGAKSFSIGLDNGKSYGNIVSACYANANTVERHINMSLIQVLGAHKTAKREDPAALFVVLPTPNTSVAKMLMKKTQELLAAIEDVGVESYSNHRPDLLATELERWSGDFSSQMSAK